VIIQCTSCQARYHYDESRFGGAAVKKIKCTECTAVFEIRNPAVPAPPAPSASRSAAGPSRDEFALDETAPMEARKRKPPAGIPGAPARVVPAPAAVPAARFSLACISGPDSGRIFEIEKPRVVIGRANADIVVADIQCSRQHAAIEVMDEHVFVVDLNSTNGTYVNDQRVSRSELDNRTEFEIGTTTLMLIRSYARESPSAG
jgi:predicted Zn finger-like uncharacterized protein